jgi:26S proteasome regulatory subunit T6
MATNRIDILDPALLRPGRIDRKIEFPNPNESSRADILRIHSRKMNLVRGIDLRKIADKMTGASGAELKVCAPASAHRLCKAKTLLLHSCRLLNSLLPSVVGQELLV